MRLLADIWSSEVVYRQGRPIALAVMVALVAAVVVPLACRQGAMSPPEPAGESIDVVEKAAGELVWADAKSGKVLFRGRDIVRFDPRRQVFLLPRDSAIDVEAWLCNRPSRGFVVRDRAGVIYAGRFIVDTRRWPYDGPTVLISDNAPHAPLFAVTGGYPRATARGGEALRHPRLLAGLRAAGVLGTIDKDYRAMPLVRRSAGWARQIAGLRIAANVYAGTFRIGRTGRVLLIFRKDGPFDLPGDTVEIRTTVRNLHVGKFASVRTETVPRQRLIEMIDAGAYIHEVRNWWAPAGGAEGGRAKPGPAEVSVELVLRAKVKDKPETTRPVKTISLFSVKLSILPDAALARARRVSPADDLAAVGNFLDHIVPRLGEGWLLWGVSYHQSTYSASDPYFDITFYNGIVGEINGRRTTVDTQMRIAGVGAKKPHRDATELPRWRGKRVFVWGGRKHWGDNGKDIAAALAATASGSVAEPTSAGVTLRAAAAFVANLDPRIPEGWQWTSVGYDARGATHPRGWREAPGHRGVQLRLDRPNRTWPTDTSAGSVRMSVTIMDPFYAGKGAKASPDSPTGRAVEIGRLGDRRVFADLRNVGHFWDGFVKEDLRAAVKATVDQRGPAGRGVAYVFKVVPTVRGPSDGAWGYDFEVSAPLRKAMLPLLKAAGQGDLAAVKKIIKARGELAKTRCPPSGSSYGALGVWAGLGGGWHSGAYFDYDGATALHTAADMGRTEVAAYLLKKGAAINAKDRRGWTPLHCVAALGRPPGEVGFWPHKTLAEAVRQRQALIKRREGLAPFLLANGADINATDREGYTPLAAAARADSPIIAKLLLARGAKLDIFSAIRLGLLDHVKAMLKIAPACVNLAGGRDRSPLHVAAGLADPAAVRLLLGHGAKLGVGKHGDTPLGRAVRAGRTETTRTLLAAGAKPNWSKCWGKLVLNYAAREGHLEIVKLLVARGAKLDTVDHDNRTALYDAACAGRMAVATFLLDKGADVDCEAWHKSSPLWGVTYLTQVDHEVDPSGARRERLKAMAAFLIARGAKVDVHSAAGLGLLDRLRAILKADPASVHFAGPNRKWSQPLTWAAGRKQLAAAKLLLDAGAKINAPGPWNNSTALHFAAGAGDLEMCTLLLDRGANVHATTKQKTTPLHAAMYRNENAPVVKLLLDHGADPNAKGPTSRDRTPLQVARINGHDNLVQLILSHVKASAKAARSTLAFRIVPNAMGSSRRPLLPLFVGRTVEKFADRAIADLAARGPGAVVKGDSGLKLRWFELACDAPAGGLVGRHKGKRYVLLCDDPRYAMVRGAGKDAWGLTSVSRAPGGPAGRPGILVKFDRRGALLTKQITQANRGNAMAVVIDGKVVAAPVIRSMISTHAVITGTFTAAEAARLIRALRAGMPASRGKAATRPTTRPAAAASPDQQKAIRALTDKLAADGPNDRARACEALGKIGPPAKGAAGALRGALKDPDWSVRFHAAFSLTKIDPTDAAPVPTLIKALADGDNAVRLAAIIALRNMGAAAEPAIPALERLLTVRTPPIAKAAAETLKRIRSGKAATRPATQPAEGAVFGPVTEAVIAYRKGFPSEAVPEPGPMYLDLDTGAYVKFKVLPTSQMVRGAGVDVYYEPQAGGPGMKLTAANLQLQPLSDKTGWNSSPRHVWRALTVASPYSLTYPGRSTLAVKTGDGGLGILQILGFTKDRRGIRIRYKLLPRPKAGRNEAPHTGPPAAASPGQRKAIRALIDKLTADDADDRARARSGPRV